MKNILCILALLVFFSAIPCSARDKISIYAGYTYFTPAASSTRDAFGGAWPKPTLGRLETKKTNKWTLTYDAASFQHEGDYDALLVPVTIGVQHRLGGSNTDAVQPYVALRAGPYYGKVEDDDADISQSYVNLNANVGVGVVIQKRYLIEARYDHFGGRPEGFRLDGFSILAGVKLFDF
jgi:hypothetical protein